MPQQSSRRFKRDAIGPAVLLIGVLGIVLGLLTAPDKFPFVSLYFAAAGSIWSVVIPPDRCSGGTVT